MSVQTSRDQMYLFLLKICQQIVSEIRYVGFLNFANKVAYSGALRCENVNGKTRVRGKETERVEGISIAHAKNCHVSGVRFKFRIFMPLESKCNVKC